VKIVADESVDKQIVDKLRTQGHEVLYIAELDPGIDDETVLLRSRESNALLLTADKDFGDLVFRQRLLHSGVLLIRFAGLTSDEKASTIAGVFELHGEAMSKRFAVLSKRSLRLRDMKK
jgi:predicted nuclease of predicted toxin-antitoxin system